MNAIRRTAPALAIIATLMATGSALAPLAERAGRASRPAGGSASTRAAAGEGLMLASLGGLRTLTADAFWLRAYICWEKQDRAGCTTYAELACTLAPETPAFREGFCNWLAFDMPHWALREAGGRARIGAEGEAAIHRRHAEQALARLDKESQAEPDDPRYPLLAGQIRDIKLKDPAAAAESYRRAAETHAAPWYPAWLYAEKLLMAGRTAEAAAFMRRYASRTPEGSPRRAAALQYAGEAAPADGAR